ncbi:YIEGIA domain-containing protein [Halalkalibacter oceani]|uniref:YIEGIA domain-containing protein n=1 Tax=Halalkalibacter oceani TaxID=1653776 RepID=UPI00255A21FA|nr:YIEGIA domain-containing protein [Halalkalibacter oceani]
MHSLADHARWRPPRQYPNYPNSYLIHVGTGGLATAIGVFFIPTLMADNINRYYLKQREGLITVDKSKKYLPW